MEEKDNKTNEIFSKILRAGRRTYFFDVRSTRAEDYYLTITESKKHTNDDGTSYYKKHKIYLYKEDFNGFKEVLDEVTKYIIKEKGEEVISDFKPKENFENIEDKKDSKKDSDSFTNIEFEDI
ncbi:MAG: DUF3276 family protein [Flavobacteriales bacterium TMED288]|nr:DNA-binding protein [Flavobacteriales bacterium]RPG53365.1 MAG: DUF3276 family protein [Flavobacteriales bacterium TMED288]|tara:strand:- start:19 stop:387 length:369 start_codon:yes stop_codon:yes gene_type:complete